MFVCDSFEPLDFKKSCDEHGERADDEADTHSLEFRESAGVFCKMGKERDEEAAVDDDEGEDGEDVKEGHACWWDVEGAHVGVHCGSLLDEERGHLGEDDRVDYCAEPDREHF